MTPLRSRVGKYAAVRDFFTEVKLPENCIAEAIESIGGVDAAHQAALRTRRMRLVPAPDMSGEQQEGETGTGFGGGYIKFPHRSRGDLAEVAALELGVPNRRWPFASGPAFDNPLRKHSGRQRERRRIARAKSRH
jgi:hypothetical protein